MRREFPCWACIAGAFALLVVVFPAAELRAQAAPEGVDIFPAGAAEDPLTEFSVHRKVDQGLNILSFHVPGGLFVVHFPFEIGAGERVTGTVEYFGHPARGLVDPDPYFFSLDGELTAAAAGPLVWNVLDSPLAGTIELMTSTGEPVEVVEVEVCTEPTEPLPGDPVPTGNFAAAADASSHIPHLTFEEGEFLLPEYAQRGRFVEIKGHFDGDFATSDVRIGGLLAEKVAESSHGIIVRNPLPELGLADIEVFEGSYRAAGVLSSFDFSLRLSPETPRLGEPVEVRVIAEGLMNLREPIPVVATNMTADVVMLRGENPCSFMYSIEPEGVTTEGRAERNIAADVVGEGQFEMFVRFTTTTAKHVKGVTWTPHIADYTFHPGHTRGHTWEPHVTGVTFSPRGHKKNVSWQPHVTDVTFSNKPHKYQVTWITHTASVSFPTEHVSGSSWEQHTSGVTFSQPSHVSSVTHKPHLEGYTYNSYGHASGDTWSPHTASVTYPPSGHVSGSSWQSHTAGISWGP